MCSMAVNSEYSPVNGSTCGGQVSATRSTDVQPTVDCRVAIFSEVSGQTFHCGHVYVRFKLNLVDYWLNL